MQLGGLSLSEVKSRSFVQTLGATDDLRIDAVIVEDGELRNYRYMSGTIRIFNAPCSSYMVGTWEMMIGSARRI